MTQVWERLYVGSRDDAEHLFRGNPHGITTVLSLCEERVLRQRERINYIHLPIADATPVSRVQFRGIMQSIATNIGRGVLLIHCGAGVSRAPIVTATWLHLVGYRNIDAALVELRRIRPIIDPSSILLKSVKEHLG